MLIESTPQRADQRSAAGRGCGTGPLTLQVTWYSRICNDTERNGDRVARRDCFKSFILPPSRRDVNDAGQPTPGGATCQDVKKNSLHENTKKLPSIRAFNDLDRRYGCARLAFIRCYSAAYAQDIHSVLHSESPVNPRLFRCFSSSFAHEFQQRGGRRFSAAFSQPFRRN